jgi:hypothetical protein
MVAPVLSFTGRPAVTDPPAEALVPAELVLGAEVLLDDELLPGEVLLAPGDVLLLLLLLGGVLLDGLLPYWASAMAGMERATAAVPRTVVKRMDFSLGRRCLPRLRPASL